MLKHIVSSLIVLSIATASYAVVRVNVLENDMTWIKKTLTEIKVHLVKAECTE